MNNIKIFNGSNKNILRDIRENTYSAIVTDPPYGLSFMGHKWDYQLPEVSTFRELLRVTVNGGHMLCFGGSRTLHRLTCNIEDAGWVIKDCIMWVYGSGFPKSLSISKSIDKHLGAERIKNKKNKKQPSGLHRGSVSDFAPKNEDSFVPRETEPASFISKQWDGYGTCLKPAWEGIIVAMKPVDETFANNAIKYGVAGLNIEECRIGSSEELSRPVNKSNNSIFGRFENFGNEYEPTGRWPANIIFDEESSKCLDKQSGIQKSGKAGSKSRAWGAGGKTVISSKENGVGWKEYGSSGYGDIGGASRFFYCAKASKKDRGGDFNNHPTCKPLKLMEYLIRLVKMPKWNKILDPFAGSGTTLVAAQRVGVECHGIEMNKDYVEIIKRRTGIMADSKPQKSDHVGANVLPVFVVGAPASGKTTLISNFIDKFDMYMLASPKATVSGEVCAAGHYAGTTFDGADRIAYDKALKTISYIEEQSFFGCKLLFLDGDRVSTSNILSHLMKYKPICIHLNIGMETHIERSKIRGSNQNENWVKGRFTKSKNFFLKFKKERRVSIDASNAKEKVFSDAKSFIDKNMPF